MRSIYRAHLCAIVIGLVGASLFAGCATEKPAGNATTTAPATDLPYATAPLPANGYKATITLAEPPTKLRPGQKVTIQVKARNASDVPWKVRGGGDDNKFYIAVGDRWLSADGTVITAQDGRYGLNRNLQPGEETEVPLLITAPKDPGEYILEIDLVQEQVAWFHDKGSPTARIKIRVDR
ncbi:MAG: hypothetical protein ACRD9S_05465 [Pyrinomonadaceae bacterium]